MRGRDEVGGMEHGAWALKIWGHQIPTYSGIRRVLSKSVSAASEPCGLELFVFLRATLCPADLLRPDWSLVTSYPQQNAESAVIRAQHSTAQHSTAEYQIKSCTLK